MGKSAFSVIVDAVRCVIGLFMIGCTCLVIIIGILLYCYSQQESSTHGHIVVMEAQPSVVTEMPETVTIDIPEGASLESLFSD